MPGIDLNNSAALQEMDDLEESRRLAEIIKKRQERP